MGLMRDTFLQAGSWDALVCLVHDHDGKRRNVSCTEALHSRETGVR